MSKCTCSASPFLSTSCAAKLAQIFKHDFEPLDGASVKHLSAILCDEDQVDMQCENAMPAVRISFDTSTSAVGMDWGVVNFVTLSDGEVVDQCH